tara:strand:+ start:655 stop:843 length:189 start_codon:yes stop_codon:yes gene_type:complete
MSKVLIYTSDAEEVNKAQCLYSMSYNYLLYSDECTSEEALEIASLLEFLEEKVNSYFDTVFH